METGPLLNIRPILVVDSDREIQRRLMTLFEHEGYEVEIAANGRSALAIYAKSAPSAIILALCLPDIPGADVCREIKRQNPSLPVVVVSVVKDVRSKESLLDLGADDYVTKPFHPKELLARVRRAIRRLDPPSGTNKFRFDGICVDFAGMNVTRDNVPVSLTSQEFKIFEYLAHHNEQVISRQELLEMLGHAPGVTTRTIDNTILRLRHKLERDPANPEHFCTVHGSGYKFLPVRAGGLDIHQSGAPKQMIA